MLRYYKVAGLLGTLSLGFCLSHARAQEPAGGQAETDAVRAASKEFLAAAHRGDENALKKLWTPEGSFVDSAGKTMKAAELIRQLTAPVAKDTKPATEGIADLTVHFVTPDVAIADGMADRICESDGSVLARRFTTVWVKRDGRWLLDSLREASVDALPLNEHLKPLDWLLGEWVATTDDAAILVSSRWSDGGNFIVRDFVFGRDGGETIVASQRIGWDPVSSQIKSWTFDSQGGAGEERWRRDGNRWLVETVDVTADGKKGKTSSVYVPGDGRRFSWEVASADVEGANLKPTRIEFKRAKDDE